MIGLSIGIGLTRVIGQGGASPSNPITGTGPVLAPLTDGDTLSSAVTWGSYLPGGATADRQMRVDGGAWVAYVGGTVVAEGEVWEAREVVSYGAWASTFVSAAQTVAEAAAPGVPVIVLPGSIDAQPLVGQPILVTDPTVSGATSTAYQWYDGNPAGSGTPISGWTGATPTPTATQYALTAPIWRRATYANDAGSVVEDLPAPAIVGVVFVEDFSSWAVGNTQDNLIAGGWARSSSSGAQYWVADIVSLDGGPSGKALDFGTDNASTNMAYRSDIDAFFGANGHQTKMQVLALVETDNATSRYAIRGKTTTAVNSLTDANLTAGINIRNNVPALQLPGESANLNTTNLPTLASNTQYFVRIEYEGAVARLKIWPATEPEPAAWTTTRTHGSPIASRGPAFMARTTGGRLSVLYFSCAGNREAPFWSGHTPPIIVPVDPMEYSASGPASEFGQNDDMIIWNFEDM